MINNLRFLGRILPLGIFILICLETNAQQMALVDKGLLSKPGYYQSNSEVSLIDVISALANKYKVKINYDAEIVAGKKLPSNIVKNGENTLESELEQILKPFNLKFEKFGKDSYAIFPQPNNQKEIKTLEKSGLNERTPTESNALKNLSSKSSESTLEKRDVTITGTVTSDTGEPLPGVNVVLKGTGIGVATDVDGKYSLKVKSLTGTLVFSFLGYTTEEIPLGIQTTIDLTMLPDIRTLGEIVVVGYGTQKKTDLTGSVISVSSKDFNAGQNTTPEQMIMGKVPGVQITSNSGAPGAGSRIRIRGGSTLTSSNDPLIVVDGVPLDNDGVSGTATGSSGLATINPNDIESFTILRDASATAIYGSRASNGVIIITTKKGKAGDKLSVGFSSVVSSSSVIKKVDMLTASEFRDVVNTYGTTANKAKLGTSDTDWQSLIFRNAISHDNNLNLTGSLKKLPYRVSVGYLSQQGILITSDLKRASGSLSLNPTLLDDHLKVNLNVKATNTDVRFADEGAIGNAAYFDPTQSPFVETNSKYAGYFEWLQGGANSDPISLAPKNPLSALQQVENTSSINRSIGNIQLDYKLHFFPDLKANLNVGYDMSSSEGKYLAPKTLASQYFKGGEQSRYSQTKSNKVMDFYLNYTKELKGINSKIDVMAGHSYQSFYRDEPSYPKYTYFNTSVEDSISTAAGVPLRVKNVLFSVFGRVNFTLKDKYLLTATIRRDGSSRFNPDNRYGLFPSVALGWRINKESFLEGSGFISDLKLRASIGKTGLQDIGSGAKSIYPYIARYNAGNNAGSYQFGDNFYTTLRPQGYDYNLKWEETTTYNAGLDFGLLGGRISGSVDYYTKVTKDMLAEINLPAGSNLSSKLTTNVGNMEFKGFEASLNVNLVDAEKTKWTIGLNATHYTNKITRLSKTKTEDAVGYQIGDVSIGNKIQVNTVGYPKQSFYVYKQVYDEKGNPVEGLYADLNNDGIVNASDLYRYKTPDAKVLLGFNSQFSHGGFSLGFVMRASIGNYVYNRNNPGAFYKDVNAEGYMINIPASVYSSNFINPDLNRPLSDYYMENASFLRMDNINIGYNFGKLINDKVTLRLSGICQNVFVITKYSGLDPEVADGIDGTFYPRPRIYSIGLTLGF